MLERALIQKWAIMPLSINEDVEAQLPQGSSPANPLSDAGAFLLAVEENQTVHLPSTEFPSERRERRRFEQDLQSGRRVRLRVIDRAPDGVWVVSRERLLSGNPWKHEVPKWRTGETVLRMRVTDIAGENIYGEVMPGVVGKASLCDVVNFLGADRASVLTGDNVVGIVKAMSMSRGEVVLDLVAFIKVWGQRRTNHAAPRMIEQALYGLQPTTRIPSTRLPSPPVRTVLIVDDQPVYLAALGSRLREDQMEVISASKSSDTLAKLAARYRFGFFRDFSG